MTAEEYQRLSYYLERRVQNLSDAELYDYEQLLHKEIEELEIIEEKRI